ncbi:peptide/nickel transport system permease protein [Nocardioides sp. YR527]|uniref:dipeptide/oligopeptide/nickel ABC transporter permease/ATP-binding protein n=1 Tax=Nocardioides sp. YR527 TaxID=1881028 RepID=UPI00088F86F2|nr:dipeptide/oligopeptide/nickel ABC transporter permease/ATP-binding protein [Nocardioides sp. YR527]SDK27494.1 peptide/nickel transport system permease protein [Nocardioides sp. YR527]
MKNSVIVKASWAVLAVVVFLAVAGPWIAPYDPTVGEISDALAHPGPEHWLGTDYLGRDTLSRLIDGARVSMIAGVEATAVALVLGCSIGMVSGLLGGTVDRVVMRVVEGISAIPAIVLAIAIIAALGSGLGSSMLAVGIAFAMAVARLARGLTLSERERMYVDGARVVGAGRLDLLRRHIAPNIAAPIGVEATLVFAHAVTIEAGLSFLGLGTQPPAASWGVMLSTAQRTMREEPFQTIPPGLALVLTVLALNIVGDAMFRRRQGVSSDNPTGYLEPIGITATAESASAGRSVDAVDGVPPLLDARAVEVRYGDHVAVKGVDLTIRRGEVVALVGESGSGKTSVAMALAGLLTSPASASAERISLAAAEPLELTGAGRKARETWRSHVGVVFQEPSAALNPLQTVGRQLRDVIEAQRRLVAARGESRAKRTVDDEIVELLTSVGLRRPAEVARLRPGQISGGMAQRVMIALALAKSPTLLIADEPTTALDVTVQAEIIALLRRLCEEHSFGVLLVTHDLGVAGELADRVVVMLHGEVVEAGPIEDVVRRPSHAYTAALVAAVPRNEPGRAILSSPVDPVEALEMSPAGEMR